MEEEHKHREGYLRQEHPAFPHEHKLVHPAAHHELKKETNSQWNSPKRMIWTSIIQIVLLVFIAFQISNVRAEEKQEISELRTVFEETTKFKDIEEKIKTLKLGMTKDEVREIMGDPLKVNSYEFKGKQEEAWIFPHAKIESTAPTIIFDEDKRELIKIIYGEDYRLGN